MILKVETLELTRAANDIEELLTDYMNQYHQLYSMASSTSTYWNGKEQEAFLNQLNEFEEEFMKLSNMISEYVAFLRTSSKAYQNSQDGLLTQARSLVR